MDDSDPAAKVSREVLRALPSRRIGLAAALLVAAGGLSAGWVSLGTQQRKWIFQATPVPSANVDELAAVARAEDMDSVWIDHVSPSTGRKIRLHALYAANADAKAPLMLFLHGARQYLGRSVFRIEQMRELGFSVLAIDYRGFGASTDELPSEIGVVEDAAAAWHWLGERHPESARYIFGHSLGGAIAVQLAARPRRPARGSQAARRHRRRHLHVDPRHVRHLQVRLAADLDADHRALRFALDGAAHQGAAPRRPRQRRFARAVALRPPPLRARHRAKRFLLIEGGTHTTTSWRGAEQYRAALREFFGLG
jgi:alpha/beta superfamily hydrolase